MRVSRLRRVLFALARATHWLTAASVSARGWVTPTCWNRAVSSARYWCDVFGLVYRLPNRSINAQKANHSSWSPATRSVSWSVS